MSTGELSDADWSPSELLIRWQSHRDEASQPVELVEAGEASDPVEAGEASDPVEASEAGEAPPVAIPTPRHAARRPEPESKPSPSRRSTDSVAASREILELLGMTVSPPGAHVVTPPATPPATPPVDPPVDLRVEPLAMSVATGHASTTTPVQRGRSSSKASGKASGKVNNRNRAKHVARPVVITAAAPTPHRATLPAAGPTTDVVFSPKLGVRRVMALLALGVLAATAEAAYLAYNDPRPFRLGVAATLLVVTLVLYGVRASSSPARLSIRSGQLEVVRGDRHEIFDLTSRYARMEVVGTPGKRGWKVLFGRFGRDPFVVDASMVDPKKFTEALQRHRPRS